MDSLASAKSYATLHHVIRKGQLYANLPYTHHLADVARVLREFGVTDPALLTAAWLHDLVEDTDQKLRKDERDSTADIRGIMSACS